MKNLFLVAFLFCVLPAISQVKIGDNPNSINANSLLEMESTNKGFLPPRVALNSTSSVSPLTGTVPAGMLVFSTGGTLVDGYYYWNGSAWVLLAVGQANLVTKTADATLTKTENFVLASNDITLTLPAITAADDGLTFTVKNIGSHMDLVVLVGNGGALIDNGSLIALPRWFALTMTAYGGNWYFKERTVVPANTMEVSPYSSWVTIGEALEFLNAHMWGPTVLKLGNGSFDISETQNIDLPYSLTIQGSSFGTTTISAASGLGGKPMFRCFSDCYFKMLEFDATTLSGYGTSSGEDAIRFLGSGTYNEVKDCNFDSFYNTILDSANAELWIFETDINNAQDNGILIHSADDSVIVKVAETDFIDCATGIHMRKGNKAIIQLSSGGYYNASASDTAIIYTPSTFTSFRSISITGNSWNNIGKYIEGFDFTRSDGRDADAFVESNAGFGDQKPNCFINVLNSSTNKTLTNWNTWYKADWGNNTSSETCKWTIENNKITYQPDNKRNGLFTVSGNLSVNSSSQNISIGIVKNGNSSVRYGETTLRIITSNQPFQFSFIAYLQDISPGDYFEIYYSNSSGSDKVVKLQDIQWFVNTQ
jgi:hypothetical protein